MLVLSLPPHKEERFVLILFGIYYFLICSGLEFIDKLGKKRNILIGFKKVLIGLAIVGNLGFFTFWLTFQCVGNIQVR